MRRTNPLRIVSDLAQRGVDVSAWAAAAREGAFPYPAAATPPAVTSGGLLERFGIDLTAKARQGELNPCVGRRDEMLQWVRTFREETVETGNGVRYPFLRRGDGQRLFQQQREFHRHTG